ncbi:MHYT domain-containing protein [Brevundimonas sp.]|uniref:MHYT domain-containing protein n=1 Tax=Brevundimonas sp. TaxID=1871086 RepID=UPI0019BA5623|nr:MHYT domain-containing protein [Brevundimonas sp.]MBD3837917.1 PAS domain-containing protein [Brevundimonas sp.]
MHHTHPIVSLFFVLSLAVAVLGAWTALDLFNRMRAHLGSARLRWLAVAALTLGASIWSMHFIAMLGFDPGSPVSYDVGLTVASLLLATAGTAVAFLTAARRSAGFVRLTAAGLAMGSAIAAMHYVGMAAMRTAAVLDYRPGLVALSVLIAVGASIAALFAAREDRTLRWRALAAAALGAAIVAMHHTGMAALVLTPAEAAPGASDASPLMLAVAVTAGSVAVLFLALGASVFDQRTNVLSAVDAGGVGFWEAQLPLRPPVVSARARQIMGIAPDAKLTASEISDRLAEQDRPAHLAALARAVAGQEDYDQEWFIPGVGRWVHLRGRLIRSRSGRPLKMTGVITDVTDRRQAFAALADSERQQRVLINELNHRVKNSLSTVQSIARQTARRAPDLASFVPLFEARLLALSNTQNLLTAGRWESVPLRDLLNQELSPFAEEQVRLNGPDVRLDPRQTLSLGLAFHELATNAAKYGALSTPNGCVRVDWSVADRHLRLDWVETGGPTVAAPARRGFGSQLIEAAVNRDLDGSAALAYPPEGFTFSLRAPLADTSETDA